MALPCSASSAVFTISRVMISASLTFRLRFAAGDLVATEDAEYRVVDYILSPPGSPIEALVRVAPARLAVAAT